MELMQIANKLKEIKPNLKSEFGIKRIGIFGSFAKGLQHNQSDIDIIVEFENPIGLIEFIKIQEYLSAVLDKSVDLLTFDSIKPYMRDDILKEVKYV